MSINKMSNFLVIVYVTLLIVTQIRAKCDDGWISFNMSCYFVERKEKETYWQAKYECEKKGATLFRPSTIREYKTLMASTEHYMHTWTELPSPSCREFVKSDMDWLVNNRYMADSANGYNSISNCAAYYNDNAAGAKYMYYYPYDYKFSYICEKEVVKPRPVTRPVTSTLACYRRVNTCSIL